MPDALDVLLNIGAKDTGRARYPVQIQCDGTPRAEGWAKIDRAALLKDENDLNPQAYGMRLYRALFAGSLGETYERLVGAAGADRDIRVRLVIHPDTPEVARAPLGTALSPLRR